MAFNDIESHRHEKALARFLEARRPPAHLRDRCDVGYRIASQSIEIFETQAGWPGKTERMESPVAKATFVRRSNRWRVFWMKRDFRWHGYEPAPEVASLDAFLDLVHRDEYCCFFG